MLSAILPNQSTFYFFQLADSHNFNLGHFSIVYTITLEQILACLPVFGIQKAIILIIFIFQHNKHPFDFHL
jgi:hypothetical protein